MQPDLARDLMLMFVERILDEVFPGETGASRLQQVGLFTIMAWLGPAIQSRRFQARRRFWMPGSSPGVIMERVALLLSSPGLTRRSRPRPNRAMPSFERPVGSTSLRARRNGTRMAGLGPAIHDLRVEGAPRGASRAQPARRCSILEEHSLSRQKAWMPGPSPGMTREVLP
jgi:hypothetical protein